MALVGVSTATLEVGELGVVLSLVDDCEDTTELGGFVVVLGVLGSTSTLDEGMIDDAWGVVVCAVGRTELEIEDESKVLVEGRMDDVSLVDDCKGTTELGGVLVVPGVLGRTTLEEGVGDEVGGEVVCVVGGAALGAVGNILVVG